MLKLPDGRVKALVQGIAKAKVLKYLRKRSLYRVKIDIIDEDPVRIEDVETEALMRNIREHSEKILALRGELTGDVSAILESIDDPGKLADLVASNLRLKIDESQMLLELIDPMDRLRQGKRPDRAGTRAFLHAGKNSVRRQGRDFKEPARLFSAGAGAGHSPGTGGRR